MSDSGLAIEPVSTRRGTWSVVLAVAPAVVGFIAGVVGLFFVVPYTLGDPRFAAAATVSNLVAAAIAWALAVPAVILGIGSIVHAGPSDGRPRRKKAIVLGSIGISLGGWIILFYLAVVLA
jgi:uncharacterized membrane protein